MTFWEFFWLIAFFFIWVAWIWLLIKVFADLFRADKSGILKAVWVILLLFLPFLGVIAYLIANGNRVDSFLQVVVCYGVFRSAFFDLVNPHAWAIIPAFASVFLVENFFNMVIAPHRNVTISLIVFVSNDFMTR